MASTLAILKLGSVEEQEYYVSTWSSILSVCAQELKHGVSIWKQSLQKNVQSQILSEPEGTGWLLWQIYFSLSFPRKKKLHFVLKFYP